MKKQVLLFSLLITASVVILPAASSIGVQESLLQEYNGDPQAFDASLSAKQGQSDYYQKIVRGRKFLREIEALNIDLQSFVLSEACTKGFSHIAQLLVCIPGLKDYVFERKSIRIGDIQFILEITPLYKALQSNQCGVAGIMLDAGASVEGTRGLIALDWAVERNRLDLVDKLIRKGVDVNALYCSKQDSPLHMAAVRGYKELTELLLTAGADYRAINFEGISPLYKAADYGHADVVELLLNKGADPNQTGRENHSPLYRAVDESYEEVVSLLLRAGADPNITPNNGYSPLHMAAQIGNLRILEMLLDHGANCEDTVLGRGQNFPLIVSILHGHAEVVERLLKKSCIQVENRSTAHCTVLHGLAFVKKSLLPILELLKPLKDRLSLLHIPDLSGNYPIHDAVLRKDIHVLHFLLECGADIQVTNAYNETSLYSAAKLGNIDGVRLLCESGIDTNKKNVLGLTALDIAEISRHSKIVKYLKEHTYSHARTVTLRSRQLVPASSSDDRQPGCSQDPIPQDTPVSDSLKESLKPDARKVKKAYRGRQVSVDTVLDVTCDINRYEDKEVFALRQPERDMTVVVYKAPVALALGRLTNLRNMSGKQDKFHTFSAEIDAYLPHGMRIESSNGHMYPEMFEKHGITFEKDGFAIMLPGKIEHIHYAARYAQYDKGRSTRGFAGAFVYLFDSKGHCYHRCFHENRETKNMLTT